ncbi:hypothetical protein GCM10025867_25120 [Frondihabitans sucicola]|uniref:Uncharacterized protein n=1 Tax=Frondihabitans sucicola TaxID=1268041 RepID=A0ABN6XZS3_9MICO|nr:hypothetical protein [Frondihabitans sucicola]BDZ50271.1 hypothetical protein GCM10025867_25120 [Frondihabitans sucicola]
MRIVKGRYKFLYVVAFLLGLGALTEVFQRAGIPGAVDWVGALGFALLTVIAVRIFRVPEEDVAAPRPLWRMTGRPTAGFLLGGLNALSAATVIWALVYSRVVERPSVVAASFPGSGLTVQIVSVVVEAALAVLYLRSSFRLARRVPAPSWVR